MTWQHYPDSPFGDVDICEHGCCREHGDERDLCVYCDHDGKVYLAPCEKCSGTEEGDRVIVQTWHDEQSGKCLRCEYLREKEEAGK